MAESVFQRKERETMKEHWTQSIEVEDKTKLLEAGHLVHIPRIGGSVARGRWGMA